MCHKKNVGIVLGCMPKGSWSRGGACSKYILWREHSRWGYRIVPLHQAGVDHSFFVRWNFFLSGKEGYRAAKEREISGIYKPHWYDFAPGSGRSWRGKRNERKKKLPQVGPAACNAFRQIPRRNVSGRDGGCNNVTGRTRSPTHELASAEQTLDSVGTLGMIGAHRRDGTARRGQSVSFARIFYTTVFFTLPYRLMRTRNRTAESIDTKFIGLDTSGKTGINYVAQSCLWRRSCDSSWNCVVHILGNGCWLRKTLHIRMRGSVSIFSGQ